MPSPPTIPSAVRVLLVEDDADSAEALLMVMSRAGYEARSVESARAAIERLRGETRPDVMVLDLTLADLGGQALVKAFAAVASRPPTIVISAAPERTLHEAAKALHARAALRKPFGTDALLRALGAAASLAARR